MDSEAGAVKAANRPSFSGMDEGLSMEVRAEACEYGALLVFAICGGVAVVLLPLLRERRTTADDPGKSYVVLPYQGRRRRVAHLP
jgi:hypothetical protein